MKPLASALTRRVLRGRGQPRLTVIVGLLDDAAGLDECLQSVSASTLVPIEVFLVGQHAGLVPQHDKRWRQVGYSTVDEAVAAASGDYFALLDASATVEREAWSALISAIRVTGSEFGAGESRRTPRAAWAADLYSVSQPRRTAGRCGLALMDLDLSGKVFRLGWWRDSGLRVVDWTRGADGARTMMNAYLMATSFDLVPQVVVRRPFRDAARPLAEQQRFQVDVVRSRLDALCDVASMAPVGWLENAVTHLVPAFYLDAVGGGGTWWDALQPRLRRLIKNLDHSKVPVAVRLSTWVAAHGTFDENALMQDELADNPHGLYVASNGTVPPPAGLLTRPPEEWRRIEAVDRRFRSRVADRVVSTGRGWSVRGASFTEYVPETPLPQVVLVAPSGRRMPLVVERRRDVRVNEWAARSWEDRSGAAWEALLLGDPPPDRGSPWRVEVEHAGEVVRHDVSVPTRRRAEVTTVEEVSLIAGSLVMSGSTPHDVLSLALRGPHGSIGGPAMVSANNFTWRADLSEAVLGSRVRLSRGRYWLGADGGPAREVRLSDELEADPPELVDDHHRVVLSETRTTAVHLRPPLHSHERGAFAQRDLRTRLYAAPAAMQADVLLAETFRGKGVGDNPGAIVRELQARETGIDVVWVVDDPAVLVTSGARAVTRLSAEWYALMGGAAFYVSNAGAPYWFVKKPGQVHLQTWHGTPLKRIGEDRGPGDFATWRHRRRIAQQASGWDGLVSPSPYCSAIFRTAFRYDGPLLELGQPRNDVLINDRGDLRLRTREKLGIGDGQQVVLYAPTWRDHLGSRDAKPLLLDPDTLTRHLPDTVVLIRGHYNSIGDPAVYAGHPRVLDVTRYPDVADLFLAADALVTDYSSVMFDFVLTDRPIVLLVPDLELYRDVQRGFYFDIEESAPGPLVTTTEAVAEVLQGEDRWQQARAGFRQRFCPYDDGRASARTVDWLLGPH